MNNIKKPTLEVTVGLSRFLEDRSFISFIAKGESSLLALIDQLQRDAVDDSNFDSIGGVILGFKKMQEAVQLIASKGKALEAVQNQTKQ